MIVVNTVTEKSFLKRMAFNAFNSQKGENFKEEDFDICSIPPTPGFHLGYEIRAACEPTDFRIHLFLNINRSDTLTPFRLKILPNMHSHTPGEEIFVSTGSIDSAHHLYGGYPFQPLFYDPATRPVLLGEGQDAILLGNGGFIYIS